MKPADGSRLTTGRYDRATDRFGSVRYDIVRTIPYLPVNDGAPNGFDYRAFPRPSSVTPTLARAGRVRVRVQYSNGNGC